jgi:hypothetical protein
MDREHANTNTQRQIRWKMRHRREGYAPRGVVERSGGGVDGGDAETTMGGGVDGGAL